MCYVMVFFSTWSTLIRKGHQSGDKWLTLVSVYPNYSSGRFSLCSFLFRGTKKVVNLFPVNMPFEV